MKNIFGLISSMGGFLMDLMHDLLDVPQSCLSKAYCLWPYVRCPGHTCFGRVIDDRMSVSNPFTCFHVR